MCHQPQGTVTLSNLVNRDLLEKRAGAWSYQYHDKNKIFACL